MNIQRVDGSAGDADYGTIGGGYAGYRQPDRRIADAITKALGDARTVVNVGGRAARDAARGSRPGGRADL
ncbi:hypothetical protein [Streptomyces sp. H27-D2]|uniref:hypothetical protein n=1 Tax=Streptomyces sp. H27-D2 TaxID=3046304 RepID=UPI002DBF1696|nr:hypothetical protein [Streptomyces sp. H27-D2]MEC4017051.1 hypothetical protein [Streptomyces sp. H27-D2]